MDDKSVPPRPRRLNTRIRHSIARGRFRCKAAAALAALEQTLGILEQTAAELSFAATDIVSDAEEAAPKEGGHLTIHDRRYGCNYFINWRKYGHARSQDAAQLVQQAIGFAHVTTQGAHLAVVMARRALDFCIASSLLSTVVTSTTSTTTTSSTKVWLSPGVDLHASFHRSAQAARQSWPTPVPPALHYFTGKPADKTGTADTPPTCLAALESHLERSRSRMATLRLGTETAGGGCGTRWPNFADAGAADRLARLLMEEIDGVAACMAAAAKSIAYADALRRHVYHHLTTLLTKELFDYSADKPVPEQLQKKAAAACTLDRAQQEVQRTAEMASELTAWLNAYIAGMRP